jgi:hypothetical protein
MVTGASTCVSLGVGRVLHEGLRLGACGGGGWPAV